MASSARIYVVTGANKGIGYAVVAGLCAKVGKDAVVYLTARSVERGTAAVDQLAKAGHAAKFHQMDVDDASSIDAFAAHLKMEHGGLDVLVNNAAIAYKTAATESFGEQAEATVRVNYFGLQAVCKALFPLLRSHARVVTVSSSVGHLRKVPSAQLRAQLAADDLTEEALDQIMKGFVSAAAAGTHSEAGWQNSTYSVSKVGASALSRIQHAVLQRDTDRQDLLVNHCHPGYVDTDMTSHKGPLSPDQGAVAPLYLALLPPNCTSPAGDYIWHDKTIVDWTGDATPTPY